MPSLNFSAALAAAPALFAARTPLVLSGPPGGGKSALVGEMARAIGARVATLLGSAASPVTLTGYIIPDGSDPVRTVCAMPPWFMTRDPADPNAPAIPMSALAPDQPVILHIEEYGQMDPDARRVLGELLFARRVGDWALTPATWIVACSNRSEDRSGVKRDFDFIINRTLKIDLSPDPAALTAYFTRKGYSHLFGSFIHQNADIVFSDAPEAQGPWMTPRSLEACARYVDAAGGADAAIAREASELTLTVFSGLVGEAAGHKLLAWLRLADALPKPSDIIKSPGTAPVPEEPDRQAVVAFALARFVTPPTAQPVVTYMRRLMSDLAVPFLYAVQARRDTELDTVAALIVSPPIAKWVNENASLIAAVTRM